MAGYKYLKIYNLNIRITDPASNTRNGHVVELRFNTKSGTVSNNPIKAIGNSPETVSGTFSAKAGNAFDNNLSTMAYSEYNTYSTWWIGYTFDNPEEIISISVQMRQDMASDWGMEWQTANIGCSDDGINWNYYGRIEPKIAKQDTRMITSNIITNGGITNLYLESLSYLNTNLFNCNYYKPSLTNLNILLEEANYNTDLKISKYSYIADHVYEENQPVVTKLYLLVKDTGELVKTTYSDIEGYFDIDKTLEYVVISPHYQHQFNSIIKDYKLE